MPALPPGVRAPRAVQTAAWITRPGPFMVRAQARFGDVFTIRIGGEPPWVMLAHPDAVGRCSPATRRSCTRARRTSSCARSSATPRCCCSTARSTCRQRKLMLPPFHGSRMAGYAALVREIAREHVAAWPRGATVALAPRMQAITLDVVLRVIFGVERGLGAARRRCATGCARCSDACSAAASMLAMSGDRPAQRRARAAVPALAGARRRAAVRADRRAPRARPATTSSRCCSPPATTTARR